MVELIKSLKYDDLITVDRMSIYKLVWKTNYNMVNDYWMFDQILNHNKLNIWIMNDIVRIEKEYYNGYWMTTSKIYTIENTLITKTTKQDLIDFENYHQIYVKRIINELGNKL